MKSKLSVSIKISLAIAVIVSINACNKQPKTADKVETKTVESNIENSAIVFVNSDSLLNNYTYFKEIKAKFEGKSKKAQDDLKSKGTAFQREVAAYQQGAATLTAEQRAATEQRLARKQQELQGYQQNAGAALQNEEGVENEKLYNKVAEYLKKYAKVKGYKMVLTYSKSNSSILFADESLDITKEVIKGLNEDYKTDK